MGIKNALKGMLIGGIPDGIAGAFLEDKESTKINNCVDNIFRDKVKPVVGSVVCCDLSYLPANALFGVTLEHSGIYIGSDKIAHKDGAGYLKIVSTNEFISRLDGYNCAMSIYLSCNGTNPVG